MRKHILLLSAYDAYSHRYWCQGLIKAFPEYQFTYLTLPARYFSWRIRGNSLTWAFTEPSKLNVSFDLIIATSMVDLSSLIGLRPSLANIPSIVYFHENQFAYPPSSQQHQGIEPQIVNLYSALASSKMIFNSKYNSDSFLVGVERLLQKLPDQVPKNVVSLLKNKSSVLPVPLNDDLFGQSKRYCKQEHDDHCLQVVWNHRWEYDKNPRGLLECLKELDQSLALCFHIVGQSFRKMPPEFDQIKHVLSDRGWLGSWGYLDNKQTYYNVLRSSHVVLSTAIHDFQGLSVLEAVAMNCIPLVPNRLSYQELFPDTCRYVSSIDDSNDDCSLKIEASSAAQKLKELFHLYQARKALPLIDIDYLAWKNMRSCYAQVFSELL